MRLRNWFKTIACAWIIAVLMGLVGSKRPALGMSLAESLVAATLVGSPAFVAACSVGEICP